MKLKSLLDYFSDIITGKELASEISDEVKQYKKGLEKKGASVPIYVDPEKIEIVIGSKEAIKMCDGFLDGYLSEWDVNYICDVLLLSEAVSFVNDTILEIIESMTDPEINGQINIEIVKNLKDVILNESG